MQIKPQIEWLKQEVLNAELANQRSPGSVLLLAVSKQQSAESIEAAYHAGIHDFGENYYQEAIAKIQQLQHLPIHWHFIGPIQSNKTKGIARHFEWVHGIDRAKIALLLNEHRPENLPPQNVCIQVNLLNEPSKSGALPDEVTELATAIEALPRLKLRGLMLIPPPMSDAATQQGIFLQLKQLLDNTNRHLQLPMDTLSMGMSDDWPQAVAAGSTIIRIGRTIFGART